MKKTMKVHTAEISNLILSNMHPQHCCWRMSPEILHPVWTSMPWILIDIGVQGMDVSHVDGATDMDAAPTTMDACDNAEANVSIRSP
jgi:hypothetical protein